VPKNSIVVKKKNKLGGMNKIMLKAQFICALGYTILFNSLAFIL